MQSKKVKLIVFLGDTDESAAKLATEFDPSARLIDHYNYKEFLTRTRDQDDVIYTSLGDLPKDLEVVYHILSQADTVVYCPPDHWSDHKTLNFTDPGASTHGLTEIMLSLLPPHIEIKNFAISMPDVVPLVDKRKNTGSQLWSVGCSITHGVGVNLSQRYGQLLAEELSMSCSFLTRSGSAIDWAADQILRSDIRANDIVVWGLTSPERLTYVYNNQLLAGVTAQSYQNYPEYKKIIDPSNLYSQNTIYQHFYAIQQVINYCQKIKAHLVLVELMSGNHAIQRALRSRNNYTPVGYNYSFENLAITAQFIDLGTDNEHPGPQQHKQYKNTILDKLKQLEII
jgi:hypothetical protein